MSQGVLIFALNNEQLDYVELAMNSARLVKKHLDKKVAIVTDSPDWLKSQYPTYKEIVDVLIKVVHENSVVDWTPYWEFSVGDMVKYNNSIWKKVNPGPEVLESIKVEGSSPIIDHDMTKYTRVYEGIDIDKWYPNLPYLVGQHVWYDDVLYRCELGFNEGDTFSLDKFTAILQDVQDLGNNKIVQVLHGNIYLKDRVLWQADETYGNSTVLYDTKYLERAYEGIDIDKWYPNLPYLVGQHVWYDDIVYICTNQFEEGDTFTVGNFKPIVKNVKELSVLENFSKGDILFYNRVLWIASVDYSKEIITKYQGKIREDLWIDTFEREVLFDSSPQYRRYFDGAMTYKRLKFKNDIRIKSFEISPFDKTLVIDCDYLINNSLLNYCWEQKHDFLISKEGIDLCGFRYDPRLHTLSDKSIDFYWATVFYFEKNSNTETFFNLLGHIQDNWNYYRYVYQIQHGLYRNDYAFSIAIHIMNGYQKGLWTHDLPGMLYYTIDKDVLLEHNETSMKFLIEKEKYKGEYTLMKTKDISVHVMNKFSVSRVIRENVNE